MFITSVVDLAIRNISEANETKNLNFLTEEVFSFKNSRPDVFLRKSVLEICSKFTGKHPCQSVVSIKFFCSFIELHLGMDALL